jgi:hypothetical protein
MILSSVLSGYGSSARWDRWTCCYWKQWGLLLDHTGGWWDDYFRENAYLFFVRVRAKFLYVCWPSAWNQVPPLNGTNAYITQYKIVRLLHISFSKALEKHCWNRPTYFNSHNGRSTRTLCCMPYNPAILWPHIYIGIIITIVIVVAVLSYPFLMATLWGENSNGSK